jgi:hypothetical protein
VPAATVDPEIFRKIFEDHWSEFTRTHEAYATQYYTEVVQKMLGCGREAGGYTEYRCGHCGFDVRRVAFTCKSCFCLSCAKVYTDDFVAQVSRVLQPGLIYRHMVLTVPEQLRLTFYRDRARGKLLSAFMKCGHQCLEAVVRMVVRQPVKIGTIVVVQTHGRSGHYNPHLHIIMTSGGINETTGKWVELGYFPYEIIHKKWQYDLLTLLKAEMPTPEMGTLINELYAKYPKGLVAHVTKGTVPERCRGLAKYLAKYVASPPIAVRRILSYTGSEVTYWYQDHRTKGKEEVTVPVSTFLGRMVQHLLPKGFQRIRYYGLHATKTLQKWASAITEGLWKIGRQIKGTYQIVAGKHYRERYQESSGCDPLRCRYCGHDMVVWRRWHPKNGTIYDEVEQIKAGRYEPVAPECAAGVRGPAVRSTPGGVPLSLSSLWS